MLGKARRSASRGIMHKRALALAIVFLSMAGAAATAADVGVSVSPAGPPPPWPRTWDWNGFYGGINVGFSFGHDTDVWNFPTVAVSGTNSKNVTGPLGGIQAGWNWHIAFFLVGIEADIDGAGQRGKQTFNSPFTVGPTTGTISVPDTDKINWIGTIRGRAGFTFDRVLIFGTGGLMWAAGTEDIDATATSGGSTVPFANPTHFTHSMIGWTAGGGAELAIANNWSVKAEYLFADLGTEKKTFATPAAFTTASPPGVPAGFANVSIRRTDNIVRVGLNYKFAPF
jgi:outer membrane immunogenic protein